MHAHTHSTHLAGHAVTLRPMVPETGPWGVGGHQAALGLWGGNPHIHIGPGRRPSEWKSAARGRERSGGRNEGGKPERKRDCNSGRQGVRKEGSAMQVLENRGPGGTPSGPLLRKDTSGTQCPLRGRLRHPKVPSKCLGRGCSGGPWLLWWPGPTLQNPVPYLPPGHRHLASATTFQPLLTWGPRAGLG